MPCDEIWIYCYDPETMWNMLALPDPRRPDRANPPTNFWWSLFWQHWHDLHALSFHSTDSQQGILLKFCFKLGKMLQKRMECCRLLFDHLAWIEHQFWSGIRDSRKTESLWGMMRDVGGVRKSIHQSWLAKGLGLELLCWGFKGVQEEIP